jgi:hypothetical protein
LDPTRANSRGANFPVTIDDETQRLLKESEGDLWDPVQNNHLILPEDRNLVTDYVFLTMRQLKIAMPAAADFHGNRHNNVLGVAFIVRPTRALPLLPDDPFPAPPTIWRRL